MAAMRWLVLAAALFVIVLIRSRAAEPNAQIGFLAVLAVALEGMAVPLAGAGFFSAAFAPIFALALLASPAGAAIVLLLGVGLRSALSLRSRPPGQVALEASSDLIPGLAALAVMAVVPSPSAIWAGLLVYLPLAFKLPERLLVRLEARGRLAFQRHREMTSLYLVGVAGLGPALAYLTQPGSWLGVWLCPLLLGMHRAARIDIFRLDLLDREMLEQSERRSRRALEATREVLDKTAEELAIESNERQVLERLVTAMARSSGLSDLLDVVASAVRQMVRCQSALIFLDQSQSPPGTIVTRCWTTGQTTPGSGMRGEPVAVALPMEGQGVLYVGRERGDFSREERHILVTVAGAGGLGIQSVRRFEDQHRARQKLQVWAQRQAFMLEGARVLAAGLASAEILQRLQELVEVTIPHQVGLILDGELALCRAWPQQAPGEPLWQVARRVAREKEPLLEHDLLAVPMLHHAELKAVIVLQGSGGFSPEQAEVLMTLAYQAAVALDNAWTHRRLQLSQAQTFQASKMAGLGQLAAGVAHELNTPLGSLLLAIESAQLFLESGKPDRAVARLDVAQGSIARCRDIISKLLTTSRGGTALNEGVTRLSELVEDTLVLTRGELERDGVRLDVDLAPDLPPVPVPSNELQQVVLSLLSNAREAALDPGARSPRVRVSTSALDGQVIFQVEDDGPGIPLELRERIFEPFFTTRPPGKGMGLGLTISHQIATAYGGALHCQVRPEGGATFALVLPVAG